MKNKNKKTPRRVIVKFAPSLSPILIAFTERKKKRRVLTKEKKKKVKVQPGLITGCVFSQKTPSSVVLQGLNSICKYTPSGDALATDSVSFKGGDKISTIDVVPIFYGSQWLTSNPSVQTIMSSIQTLFGTPFLSQMTQYGFSSLNVRQPVLVTNVTPGAKHNSGDIGDIVWNLIDNDVFPEPDDAGGRNCYMVFYPGGTAVSDISACGWHSAYWDYDFPFDVDWAWVGAVEFPQGNGSATPQITLDNIIRIFSHELIEMITDPNPSDRGWEMNRTLNGGKEIGDACNNSVDFSNGIFTQAYWSEKHKACIIAKAKAYIGILSQSQVLFSNIVSSGVVYLQNFCFNGDYKWTSTFNAEKKTYTAKPNGGLPNPTFQWSLPQRQYNSQILSNGFSGTVYVQAETYYDGINGTITATKIFPLQVQVQNDKLIVTNQNPGNLFTFSLDVKVTGTHGASVATNQISDGYEGQTFAFEASYYSALKACRDRFYRELIDIRFKIPHIGPDDYRWGWEDKISHFVKGERYALAAEAASLAAAFQAKKPEMAFNIRSEASALAGIPIQNLEPVQIARGKIIQ